MLVSVSSSGQITGIALGVPAGLIFCLALFFLGMLYHRGLAIRRKRAMRRYLESGEVRPQIKPTAKATRAFTFLLRNMDFIGRALSHWGLGRKVPKFTPAY